MSRKGYYAEYKVNQMLKKEFPDCDILRNPICDFMIIRDGKIIKLIEIKSTHEGRKFYPTPREKEQIERIKQFSIKHNIDSYILHHRINGKTEKIWINKVYNKEIAGLDYNYSG